MYKLHCFAQSGNCYKVALLLQALQQPWAPLHVPFSEFLSGRVRDQDWRDSQNIMGEVPILESDGKRHTQSAAIMWLLSERHGAFGGRNDDERQEVMRWLFFDNHKFTSYFATWRFMKSFSPSAPDPSVAKFLHGRIENAFGIVDRHLTGRDFIVGDAPTIADMSLCGYLYYPSDESGYDVATRYPAIAGWLTRLQRLPGWKGPYDLLPGEQIAPKW